MVQASIKCCSITLAQCVIKLHTVTYKQQISLAGPIDLVGRLSFLCHICFRIYESSAKLMSHSRRHEWRSVDGGGVRERNDM